MGTVIYFPDKNPVELNEMRTMMCGGISEVTSRMDFGYDFILKTIQSGNRNWLDILEKSYWRRQRQGHISQILLDKAAIESRIRQIALSEEEAAAFSEKLTIETQIRENTNAKRKKAELALRAWKDNHSGARWAQAELQASEFNELTVKLKRLNASLEKAHDVSSAVESRIKVLQGNGFLKVCDDLKSITKESLTVRGVLASELNECDSLLVSQLFLLEQTKSLEPKELLAVLSACIVEGAKRDGDMRLDNLDVPSNVQNSVLNLIDIWNALRDEEDRHGVKATDLRLSPFWVSPIIRWMEGEPIASI
jgi:superfamily II RNA helicase